MLTEKEMLVNGTQVSYFIVCHTKLWLFSHFIRQEQSSDLVAAGKAVHETTFERPKKDVRIDSKVSIDFIEKNGKIIVHEVKKSRKLEKAHAYQLLYYLYCLKQKGIDAEGEINYPLIRKIERIKLTPEKEEEIKSMLQKIKDIVLQEKPPNHEKKQYCRKCSYFEFCWC